MGEIRLDPIEWGVVTVHHPWGLGVRLEESGDEGIVDRAQIHYAPIYFNEEYWPDPGERIQVRRLTGWNEQLRLLAVPHDVPESLAGRDSVPSGLGPVEWGIVTTHHDWGVSVRLEVSGDVGALRRRLMDDDPARCAEEFWPATGERIRVCRLGTWPDGELRLTRRECFLSMVERPQFQRLRAQRPARIRGSAEEPSDRRTPELG